LSPEGPYGALWRQGTPGGAGAAAAPPSSTHLNHAARRHEHTARSAATYPYRSPVMARSFVRLCRALTRRTVPDRARITIDSVVAVEPS
jgi:hypothetical protein